MESEHRESSPLNDAKPERAANQGEDERRAGRIAAGANTHRTENNGHPAGEMTTALETVAEGVT